MHLLELNDFMISDVSQYMWKNTFRSVLIDEIEECLL